MAQDTQPAATGLAIASPWAFAGMSLASGLLAQADKNDALAQKAKDFGIRRAGIDSAKKTQISTLITQAAQIKESKQLQQLALNKSQAQAEAQLTVEAAAAGVEGVSVNQVIDSTEQSLANAEYTLQTNTRNAQNQLKLSFVDTVINADTQTGTLDTSTTSPDLSLALDFVQGFQSGFVTTKQLEGN